MRHVVRGMRYMEGVFPIPHTPYLKPYINYDNLNILKGL